MKKILKFNEFVDINESYLTGSRSPLYHFTSSLHSILDSDELRTSYPSKQSHDQEKSISLTRSIDYGEGNRLYNSCLELDTDKLLKYGYKSYPVDEWAWEDGKRNKIAMVLNFNKSNFNSIKSGERGVKHNISSLPKDEDSILSIEFEERIFKDIKNIGEYILKIYTNEEVPDHYLEKYPHIEVYNLKNINDFRNVVKKVQKAQKNINI